MSNREYPAFLADCGLTLLKNGWPILPIARGGKRPTPRNWQKTTLESALSDLPIWLANEPDAGVGFLCGELVGYDLDIDPQSLNISDDDAEKHIEALTAIVTRRLGPTRFHRVGRAPKLMLVYRASEAVPGKKRHPVELIGSGAQFVSFHIHPDTGLPYRWLDASPLTSRFDELPLIDAKDALPTLEALAAYCAANGLVKTRKPKASTDQAQLPLAGAAPTADPNAAVSGTSVPNTAKPKSKQPQKGQPQTGGRESADSWQEKLKAAARSGGSDEITGSVAASYAASTSLLDLDESRFMQALADAAKANGFDLAAKDRRSKLGLRNLTRSLKSAVDLTYRRTPIAGEAVKRVSISDATRKLSVELSQFGRDAAEWSLLARQLEQVARKELALLHGTLTEPAGYEPSPKLAAYARHGSVAKLVWEADYRAWESKAGAELPAWLAYERGFDLVEAGVIAARDKLIAPMIYATATPGVGKTEHAITAVVEHLKAWRQERKPRILWATGHHALLDATRARLKEAIAKELDGILTPDERAMLTWAAGALYWVRSTAHNGACDDEARAELHKTYAETSVSRTRSICGQCPLSGVCDTHAVNQLPADASGVFFISDSQWTYHVEQQSPVDSYGKYDIAGADLLIADEDVAKLTKAGFDLGTLDGTALALPIKLAAQNIVAGWNPADDTNPTGLLAPMDLLDALAAAAGTTPVDQHATTPQLRQATMQHDWTQALIVWRGDLLTQADTARKAIETALESGEPRKAGLWLPKLHTASSLLALADALMAWLAAWRHDAPFPVACTINRAENKTHVLVKRERPGLRRTWRTPTIWLNGTPRLAETLAAQGPWAKTRPVRVVGDEARPGEGVTHVAVPDLFIGSEKLTGVAAQSFTHAVERLYALLVLRTGNALAISQKAGREAMGGDYFAVADAAAEWLQARGLTGSAGRLHFGAQRGHDEFRDVGGLLLIGQALPPPSEMAHDAAARALPAGTPVPTGTYERALTPYECADGSFTAVASVRHTSPAAEAERQRVVADECTQAMHRGRAVWHRLDKPQVVVSVGTEYGLAGVPVNKFTRLCDVYGVREADLPASLGVVPLTPMGAVRSRFARLWAKFPGIEAAVKGAAANIEKHGLIPDAQALVDRAYLLDHLLSGWKPGDALLDVPTWEVWEGRPALRSQPAQAQLGDETRNMDDERNPTELLKYKKQAEFTPGTSVGFHALPGSSGALQEPTGSSAGVSGGASAAKWGQHGHKPRWLVKRTGDKAWSDAKQAIEYANGPVRDLVLVEMLRPQLSELQRHALAKLGEGIAPRIQ